MFKLRVVTITVLILMITTSCGQPNVLKGYSSNVQSDEALFLDAKNKLDSSDWDSAISIITTSLSAS
ncbi:MAG: hypothetical protein ACXWRZ_14620, partial [Bdellovibrio sp.]